MPELSFPLVLTAKVDYDTYDEIQLIANFERTKTGTFMRTLAVEAVQRYRRNPQYLKWKRDREGSIQKEVKRRKEK